ncbi:hypothetical protein LguiB_035086 [Lonicera macranthoides]
MQAGRLSRFSLVSGQQQNKDDGVFTLHFLSVCSDSCYFSSVAVSLHLFILHNVVFRSDAAVRYSKCHVGGAIAYSYTVYWILSGFCFVYLKNYHMEYLMDLEALLHFSDLKVLENIY